MDVWTREDLIRSSVPANKYLFFWSHKPQKTLGKSCLSQWYDAPFRIDGTLYRTAEHYMMAEKARLFGDFKAQTRILEAKHPGEAKRIGRLIAGFDERTWRQHRDDIVVRANRAKFGQNTELGAFLEGTGQRVLVEASPHDNIWGIGLRADHPHAANPALWPGLNLLGFALMRVRMELEHSK